MKVTYYKGHKITRTPFKLPVIRQCFDNYYRTAATLYIVRGPVYNIWNLLLGCTSLEQCKEEINTALSEVMA